MDRDTFRALIDDVRGATDLVDLIGETVALRRMGSCWSGRSPWRQDRDPSLRVWPHTQTWRDFSGGGSDGGDCFEWVRLRDGVPFLEALQTLATRAGVQLPEQSGAAFRQAAESASEARSCFAVLTFAVSYCHRVMTDEARALVREQWGLTDETIDEFRIGMSDGHLLESIVDVYGATEEEALATGLFVRTRRGSIHEFLPGRILFPYWHAGRVVYLVARQTEWTPDREWERGKYKKLRIFDQRAAPYISRHIRNSWFYGEDGARHGSGPLLITEGVTDCIAAHQAGFRVCSPVTTRFRRRDVPRLLELAKHADRVLIVNDNERPDADGRRPGFDGALVTAEALYREGVDVRILTLPRPAGLDKVDLCDYLREHGEAALRELLPGASTYPSTLIDQVPADTHPTDLDRALSVALQAASRAGESEREWYRDRLVERFNVSRGVAAGMLRRGAGDRERADREELGDNDGPTVKGAIWKDPLENRYLARGIGRQIVAISSFVCEPIRRMVADGDEVWEVDLVTDRGRSRAQIPRSALNSRAGLLARLKTSDAQWTGTDDHGQGLLRLLSESGTPVIRGSYLLGRYQDPEHGACWVSSDRTITACGEDTAEVAYVDTGASLAKRVSYPDVSREEATGAAITILPSLSALNVEAATLPILGWFLASLCRSVALRELGHFPFLAIHGTQGAGKTSLVQHVFWPLLGASDPRPYSAGQTEFATLKLLSSSNAIPVVFDEFKPYAMVRSRRDRLIQLIHETYVGAAPERGRADQTTVSYPLLAPLCLIGETRPSIPALIERMVPARPSKEALTDDCAQLFEAVRAADPHLLAPSLVRFALGFDFVDCLESASAAVLIELRGRRVPHRVRDNFACVVAGLWLCEAYARSYGIRLELNVGAAVEAMFLDLYDEDSGAVRTQLEVFLESLSVMAVLGKLERDKQWTVIGDSKIGLHFGSCHSSFAEHERRVDSGVEVPDKQSLRRQIRDEAGRSDGFVVDARELIYFAKRYRRRAVVIDLKQAEARGLDLDGFATEAVRETHARRADWTETPLN